MRILNPKRWVAATGAGLLATVALLPQAEATLVYESDAPVANENSSSVQVDERSDMRQALGASRKAQVTLQAQAQAQPGLNEQEIEEAPAASMSAAPVAQVETQNYSRAELMRRERHREEVKNEDLLQQRLEELRLRDERQRLNQVFGAGAAGTAAQDPAPVAAPLQEEVVVAPVTEHPGVAPQAPTKPAAPAKSARATAASEDSIAIAQSSVSTAEVSEEPSEKTRFSVAPRAGISNMVGQGDYFDVRPRYSVGIAGAISASDNLSFEVGYTFSEFGVAMASTNPFAIARQNMAAATGGSASSFESVAMKQNVLDAGLKVHLLGPDAKLRPFVTGGGAYSKSFINFDSRVLADMNRTYGRNVSPDYEVSSFLGYLGTGMDVRISRSISVGAEFKYHAVLSSRESDNFNNYYGAFTQGYLGTDTSVAGGSLARSSFYSIRGNLTFTF